MTDKNEHAAALGRITSERKAAASRANLEASRAARPVKPCSCGRTEGKHAASCPEYRRQAVAKYRARKKERGE